MTAGRLLPEGLTSTFVVKPLPSMLRLANSVAGRLFPGAPLLVAENLLEAAARRAGLPVKFPPQVHAALDVLCRSLATDAKHMHWFGKVNQYSLIVTGLAEYLRVEEFFRRHPGLQNTPLLAPIIVTGLPRSGTTFLHRLLSASGDGCGVPMHWHIFPSPRRLHTSLLETAILFEPWGRASRSYNMDSIHLVRPHLPDECNFGLRLDLHSSLFWSTAPTYQYLEWLLSQDLFETYAFYRKSLILHQLRAGPRPLVLKCPHHMMALPALRRALPEASIVMIHRDPIVTVASECSLLLSLQAVSMPELDARRTVAANYRRVVEMAQRGLAYSCRSSDASLVHVGYHQLLSDPVKLAATIHERLALEWGAAHERKLQIFCSANRQHKHGKHSYSLEQFGLDSARVAQDFAEYRQHFHLA